MTDYLQTAFELVSSEFGVSIRESIRIWQLYRHVFYIALKETTRSNAEHKPNENALSIARERCSLAEITTKSACYKHFSGLAVGIGKWTMVKHVLAMRMSDINRNV